MPAPTRPTAQHIYQRVLWTAAAFSWIASMIVAMALLVRGVQLDWPAILLWAMLVAQLTIGAMVVSSMPNAEAIAERALAVARAEARDELHARRT